MSIKQLSVFVGNEKGSIADITDVLAGAGINLHAMNVADTVNFGILRLIADDTDKALDVLKGAGVIASVTEVVAFAVPDEPGGLSKVLRVLADNDVNTEYIYSLITTGVDRAYIVVRVSDNGATEKLLTESGFEVISDGDISEC